jgi:hypothetical protein
MFIVINQRLASSWILILKSRDIIVDEKPSVFQSDYDLEFNDKYRFDIEKSATLHGKYCKMKHRHQGVGVKGAHEDE